MQRINDVVEWVNETGELHRLDGPAIEYNDGDKEWWVAGQRHRIDGPAIEWSDGVKEWWVAGKRHREDGPAVIFGKKCKWFLNGIRFSSKEAWFKSLDVEKQIAYLFKME